MSSAHELVKRFTHNPKEMDTYYQALFLTIEQQNPAVNALTSLQKNASWQRIQELQKNGPQAHQSLYGVPVVIKENIQKKDYPVECASKILQGYRGQYDATAVSLLENAGAVMIATANMDEFAMGSSNEHSVHGPVNNPHDLARVGGGSSGGPAVACTMGFAPLALGSDTGGSVREPAAFCGIFGFKPTYGRVSRFGLVAYGSSLDQISPFARTAHDLDLIMQVMGQTDVQDATTLADAYTSYPQENLSLNGLKMGIPHKILAEGLEPHVRKIFDTWINQWKALGGLVVEIDAPEMASALAVYYLVACAEASSNLARFDGIRYGARTQAKVDDLSDLYAKTRGEGFGFEVKKRILLGTYALSTGYYDAMYGRAELLRQKLKERFQKIFHDVDFICTPTAPCVAFQKGASQSNPMQEYLCDILTIPANLTGVPALSVPAPVPAGTLPVGIQLMAPWGQDAHLIALGKTLEQHELAKITPLLTEFLI